MKNFLSKHKVLTIVISLLVIVYVAGLIYFSMKSYPRTTVNGEDRGLLAKQDVFKIGKNASPVEVKGLFGESLTVNPQDIDYVYEIDGSPQLEENNLLWPIELLRRHDYQIDFVEKYDEVLLDFLLLESDFDENGKPAKNASIEITDTQVDIIPEEIGTKVDHSVIKEQILSAMAQGEPQVQVSDAYDQPTLKADDPEVVEEAERYEKIFANSITLDFDDRQYTLGGMDIFNMYDENEEGDIILDEEDLVNWVAQVARETDTYGTTRTFNAIGVGQIQVPPGIMGWQMNVRLTVEKMVDLIKEGGAHTIEPVYNISARTRATDDIGGTYIEVDLSRQYLWAYVDYQLVFESSLVSGMGNTQWSTPIGVNEIWSKEKEVILYGTSFDTEVGYETPVKYWMPINWGGVGLHDADWRDTFGGEIYMGNGSNGCLNLPEATAEQIFNTFPVGTPVIVYESFTNYSNPENI